MHVWMDISYGSKPMFEHPNWLDLVRRRSWSTLLCCASFGEKSSE